MNIFLMKGIFNVTLTNFEVICAHSKKNSYITYNLREINFLSIGQDMGLHPCHFTSFILIILSDYFSMHVLIIFPDNTLWALVHYTHSKSTCRYLKMS